MNINIEITDKTHEAWKYHATQNGFDSIDEWIKWLAWKQMIQAGYNDKDTQSLDDKFWHYLNNRRRS